MKKLVFVVIGVIAVIGLLTAFAGDGRRFDEGERHSMRNKMEKGDGRHGMMQEMHDGYQMMCEELDLTDEQKEQMEDLRIKGKKSMIAAGAELELLGIDKREVMKDKDFKQAKAITKEMFKLKQQIAINRIEHHEKRWNILTPEQKEKAEELRGEHPRRESRTRFLN